MSNIDKQAVKAVADLKVGYTLGHADVATLNELARIALASLEAEAVADVVAWSSPNEERTCDIRLRRHDITAGPLYTAPPVPVEDTDIQRKAAIHDALCEKYNVESLSDFVDWQRNHIAELEAAPPAPVGEGESAVMPDYPGYAMTQRECFEAGKKAGMAELVTTAYKLPDGYALVPVEPTYQMCEAMGLPWESPRFPDRYKAMIAAAPKPEVK